MSDQPYTFDLYRILLDKQPPFFLLEVLLRTTVVYGATLIFLRWMGKRGMGQLTPFEFAIIVALGSAVGDPMFYDNVPILPALLTIIVIVILQRLLSRVTENNPTIEHFIESVPRLLVEAGVANLHNLHEEMLSRDELFEALRQQGIHQLGQVAVAYLEPSGKLSVIKGAQNRPGLSILPEGKMLTDYRSSEPFSQCCEACGQLRNLSSDDLVCVNCEHTQWVPSTGSELTEG